MHKLNPLFPALAFCAAFALPSAGQDQPPACPIPPNLQLSPPKYIFTPEQEIELGDVFSEHIEQEFHIIDDPKLTAYLNDLAQRIVAQLPPTGLHFQVYLYDDAVPNAFSVAGGRIYVSRKLVAFVKDEAELAGLLGHEMGHIVSH
jgi:predicted Zn-dependent protease